MTSLKQCSVQPASLRAILTTAAGILVFIFPLPGAIDRALAADVLSESSPQQLPTPNEEKNRSTTAEHLGGEVMPDCLTIAPYGRRDDCAVGGGNGFLPITPVEVPDIEIPLSESTESTDRLTVPLIQW